MVNRIDMYCRSIRAARVTLFLLQLTISFKFLKVQLMFVSVVAVFISVVILTRARLDSMGDQTMIDQVCYLSL